MMDYTLYPIKKRDVDWTMYQLVSHYLKLQYHLDSLGEEDVENVVSFREMDNDAQHEERRYSYRFVFPNEDLSIGYDEAMLEQELVILKCFHPIKHLYPIPFIDDEDDEGWFEYPPMEYFSLEKQGDKRELRHHKTNIPSKFPDCVYNGDDFLAAIQELRSFLARKNLAELSWYSRLGTVADMLQGDANELHILHNAGLFDHGTLWLWLEDYGIKKAEYESVKELYLKQLKCYTMFVLNRLDWAKGTSVSDLKCKQERKELYSPMTESQIAATFAEQERRIKMFRNRPKQSRVEPLASNKAVLSDSQKSENRKTILVISAFAVVVLVVFGLLVGLGNDVVRATTFAVGGIVAIVAGRVAAASRGIHHRHPYGFRVALTFVGCLLPFLFGWTGSLLMKALIEDVTPQIMMIFVFLLMSLVIVASALLRSKQTDERKMRPYTMAIVVAVMEIIGHFVGGFIKYI